MGLVIRGRVVSGAGEGRKFMELEWVRRQIVGKLGFDPYPGTLNLEMGEESREEAEDFLSENEGVAIEPKDESFYPGKCFKARIGDRVDGAVIVPLVPSYPRGQVEIIAPCHLRETLGLKDGQWVKVEVF